MRKRILSAVSVLLAVTILCCVPVFAAETRVSDQIRTCNATMSRSSSGTRNIVLKITTTEAMDSLGASSVAVQRYTGAQWATEYTFTVQNTPELQVNNRNLYTVFLSYSPNYPESTYRAIVYFYAKGSLGISTAINTTNSV